MIERRINQLERRFRRDNSYFQYYKTFIDDMLAKGYAKEPTSPAPLMSSIPTDLEKSEWYFYSISISIY